MEPLFSFGTEVSARKGSLGKLVLSALQPGDRSRPQIRRGLYVRANRGNKAAAKIIGAAHMLLPTVLRLAGHGTAARGRA